MGKVENLEELITHGPRIVFQILISSLINTLYAVEPLLNTGQKKCLTPIWQKPLHKKHNVPRFSIYFCSFTYSKFSKKSEVFGNYNVTLTI